MIIEIASAAWLVGNFIYHRYRDKPDIAGKLQELSIPRSEEGAAIPLVYGRCRVRAPVLAWRSAPASSPGTVGNGYPLTSFVYKMDMYFVVGIGFADGAAVHSGFHSMWAGDTKFTTARVAVNTTGMTEIAGFGVEGVIGSSYQWYDGAASQLHVDDAGVALTAAGLRMLPYWAKEYIPGYRGLTSVFLFNNIGPWYLGATPSIPAYSFEVSSYHYAFDYPCQSLGRARIGDDANPIQVLWDLLVCKYGKLGIPSTLLDRANFSAAAAVCVADGLGYSRSMEDTKDGSAWILEILEFVDGVLYEDPSDGKIKIKLIRPDFAPGSIRQITKDNCDGIINLAMSTPSGVPNAVSVSYTDRASGYQTLTVTAKNPANAVGQSDRVRWVTKSFPGCTVEATAYTLANRELAAEGRCVIKCRALMDRSAYDATPGEPVRVTWSKPGLDRVVFRVAAVDRGTLEDGKIALDLISDYFFTSRNRTPSPFAEPDLPIRPRSTDLLP